jgi:prepilin-type N-terminal cleavage/methylation domain-containing protein/prepilin-type processing-associated H-X9-DG protein
MKKMTFTLLELLIVIAIITILASMFLPALSKAREMGKRTLCASNLKQVGLSLSSYLEDSGGWGPPDPASDFWHRQLANNGNLIRNNSIVCPSWPPYKFTVQTANYERYTYGINRDLAPDIVGKLIRRTYPTRDGIFADSIWGGGSGIAMWQWKYFNMGSLPSSVHIRHSANAEMFFLDGHVENCGQTKLLSLGFSGLSMIK